MKKQLLPEHLTIIYDSYLGGKDHSVCMNCHTKDNLSIDKNKQDEDIVAFIELHQDCLPMYSLIANHAPKGDESLYRFRSHRYQKTEFSFESLIEVIRMEVNNPNTWNVRIGNRNIPCYNFISLFHNGLNENEILEYKYF